VNDILIRAPLDRSELERFIKIFHECRRSHIGSLAHRNGYSKPSHAVDQRQQTAGVTPSRVS